MFFYICNDLRLNFNVKLLKNFYTSFVQFLITYCIKIWGGAYATYLNQLKLTMS